MNKHYILHHNNPGPMRLFFGRGITLFLAFWTLLSAHTFAQSSRAFTRTDRLALVIGNSAYMGKPLPNAKNDAVDMKKALEKVGFEVIFRENLDQIAFEDEVSAFARRLQNYSVGLFYFAGHGFEGSDNINYLNSIEVRSGLEEAFVQRKSISLNDVMASMKRANSLTNILLIDACRNNPFRSWGRSDKSGLGVVNTPVGTIAFFAASPGQEADENPKGRNGLFTQELLKNLGTPNLELSQFFKRTARAVAALNKYQHPYQSGFITDDFYFKPEQIAPTPESAPPAAVNYDMLYSEGQRLFDMKSYLKAYPLIKEAAEAGNSDAQNTYATFYWHGYGVKLNKKTAFDWFLKSAEQDNVAGQINVGMAYRNGTIHAVQNDVERNYPEALKWYRKAAEVGNATAQCYVGEMYYGGFGVAKDDLEAFKWFRKAAEQGTPGAQNMVGYMYHYGEGVFRDFNEAFKWYEKSANQGYASAQSNLALMHRDGQGIPKNMDAAVYLFQKAARQGYWSAQKVLKDLGKTW